MKILGLIPARGGSKGVPKKNIKSLYGKPLIYYTITPALDARLFDELVVSTDDEEIGAISTDLGANVQMRPMHLASDKSPTIDTVIHVLETYLERNISFDVVCLLQPTNPLRTKETLIQSLRKFKESEADSLVSVRQVPHEFNPHWTFKVGEGDGFLKIATGEKNIIPRRQELPKTYHRDGSIYLVKSQVVLEQKSLYGDKISYIDLTREPYVNIDTTKDWLKAEEILSSK